MARVPCVPEIEQCRRALRAGDTLAVRQLDRLGRSSPDQVHIIADLEQRGIGFENLAENIETNGAAGKLVAHVFAVVAEFERDLIRERTQACLAAERARGRAGGRKPKLDDRQISQIKSLLRGLSASVVEVARDYGVSRTTIYKHCGVVTPRDQQRREK